MGVNSIDAEDDQFAYRYDTQLLIERRDQDLDEDEISDYITVDIPQDFLSPMINRELGQLHLIPDGSGGSPEAVDCQVGMDVFGVNRRQ